MAKWCAVWRALFVLVLFVTFYLIWLASSQHCSKSDQEITPINRTFKKARFGRMDRVEAPVVAGEGVSQTPSAAV